MNIIRYRIYKVLRAMGYSSSHAWAKAYSL